MKELIGWTEEMVWNRLQGLIKEKEKSMASFSESGTSVTYRKQAEIDEDIRWCQSALQKLNPFKYGKSRRTCQSSAGSF
jgi:hypothetical protein